jgi:ABC-type molybdate transport system substrate-binding protein
MPRGRLALHAVLIVVLVACSAGTTAAPSGSGAAAAAAGPLTVFAAASLKGALVKAKTAWESAAGPDS